MTTFIVKYVDNATGQKWQRLVNAPNASEARVKVVADFPLFSIVVRSVHPVTGI